MAMGSSLVPTVSGVYVLGSVGSGTDTQKFTAALAQSKPIMIPNGTYTLTSLLEAENGFSMFGESRDGVQILVNADQFLRITDGPNYSLSTLRNMTIVAMKAPVSGSYGLKHDISAFSAHNGLLLDNITIIGDDDPYAPTHYFEKPISAINSTRSRYNGIEIRGGYNSAANPSGQFVNYGPTFEGQSVENIIDGLWVYSAHTGLTYGGTSEGLKLSNAFLVSVRDGIDASCSSANTPGIDISSTHVNSARIGVKFDDRADVAISNLSLYRAPTFFVENYTALPLDSVAGLLGSNIIVSDSIATATAKGITLASCLDVNMSNLALWNLDVGIEHNGSNNSCQYNNVSFSGGGTTGFSTAASDSGISLGTHKFTGTQPTTKYSIATQKNSITINVGRVRRLRITPIKTYTAAGSEIITSPASQQAQRFAFGAGAGIYTYNLDVSVVDAQEGDFFIIYWTIGSSTNPTFIINSLASDGVTRTALYTSSVSVFTRLRAEIVFDPVAAIWIVQDVHESLA